MFNATGQHTLGSGRILFAQFLPGGQVPGAYRYLGNTPEFGMTASGDTLQHMNADDGIKQVDDDVQISSSLAANVVTDNLNQENLSLWYAGTTGIITDSSATGTIENIAEVQFGKYQLGVSDSKPTGVRRIASVVVTDGQVTPTTYVAGTDYVIDAISGTITFIEGGTLEQGDPVKITYNVTANSREQVISGNTAIKGALRFESKNPVGPQRVYTMPYVRMMPDGDFPLKGDDWLTMTFNIAILNKGDLERVYVDGESYIP